MSYLRFKRATGFIFLACPALSMVFDGEFTENATPRIEKTVNREWAFQYFSEEKENEAQAAVICDDSDWRAVALPHTWQTYETTGQVHPFNGFASGIGNEPWWKGWGWYRKHFKIAQSQAGRKVRVEFDGVQKYCKIYLNGVYLGDHKGGYNSFYFDLTEQVRFGEDNVLAVAVQNLLRNDPLCIPPMHAGNFNVYGGIYRDVRIVITDRLHIPYQGSYKHEGGTFVTTPQVSETNATVRVRTWVKNDYGSAKSCTLVTSIIDPDGRVIQTLKNAMAIPAGGLHMFDQTSEPVNAPWLWSIERPVLYKIHSRVCDGDRVADAYESPLGFRWFEWDYKQNVGYLNGKRLHIHGTNRNQEYPWLGDAIPKWIAEMDLYDIRYNLGHNFMRTAHYPNDPSVYQWFDRHGMIICEEVPNIKSIQFSREVQEQNCREMVRRDRNHPSIIMWSVGNETHYPADSAWVHEEDDTRLIHVRHAYNMKPAGDFVTHTDKNMDMENLLRVTIRGWTHDEGRGAPSRDGQMAGTEEWQHETARQQNASVRGRIDMPNGVMWLYADHGAARIYKACPLKFINPKGWVDLYRIPKYMYYLWQANYAERPMVFIHPHDWTSSHVGQTRDFVVDSNCESVELKVNGVSQSVLSPCATNFHTVTFSGVKVVPGTLTVVGTCSGVTVTNEVVMAGPGAAVVLSVSHKVIEAALDSVVIVKADIVDAQGVHVQGATNTLEWSLSGPGTLVSAPRYESNITRNGADEGVMYITTPVSAVVRSNGKAGKITVQASCAGLVTGTVLIEAVEPKRVPSAVVEPPLERGVCRGGRTVSSGASHLVALRKPGDIAPAEADIHMGKGRGTEYYRREIAEIIVKANPKVDSDTSAFRALCKSLAAIADRTDGTVVADDYDFFSALHNECAELER